MFRVIDLETTGVDHETDKIVEIASVDVAHDLEIGAGMEHFVNPGIPIPPESSAIHHIIDKDVQGCKTLEHILPYYQDEGVIYVAHNARFEGDFLPNIGPWICTYKASVRIWPNAPGHSNQVLRYWLNLPVDRNIGMPHRALPDCIVTAALLVRLLESGATVDDMLRWTKLPVLKKMCKFGKHAGKEWKDVPKDYLQWIVRQGDFDEDTLYTAKVHLGLVEHS